jgi:hypothetical protein
MQEINPEMDFESARVDCAAAKNGACDLKPPELAYGRVSG